MSPVSIYVTESPRFSPAALRLLESVGLVELADVHNRAELLSNLHNTEILWVRLRHCIDKQVMDAAPSLRAIASATTGLNHIDLEEAERRSIRIISLRGQTSFLRQVYATGEHTIALILALIRRLPSASQSVLAGSWDRDGFVGHELHDKTAGIVGYGRVGRMVARYLLSFGMRVQFVDPIVDLKEVDPGVEITSLENLLSSSDVVTLHVDFKESRRGFFGRREFALMKERAPWFINTSRGELVDEPALLEALQDGAVKGAALDVLAGETASGMADHPLVKYARKHDHLLITPHIGGCTDESTEKTEKFIAEQVVAFCDRTGKEFRKDSN